MWAASTAKYFRGKQHQIKHNDHKTYSRNLSLIYMEVSKIYFSFCKQQFKNQANVGVEKITCIEGQTIYIFISDLFTHQHTS
jgi:hypothetical protein